MCWFLFAYVKSMSLSLAAGDLKSQSKVNKKKQKSKRIHTYVLVDGRVQRMYVCVGIYTNFIRPAGEKVEDNKKSWH